MPRNSLGASPSSRNLAQIKRDLSFGLESHTEKNFEAGVQKSSINQNFPGDSNIGLLFSSSYFSRQCYLRIKCSDEKVQKCLPGIKHQGHSYS